MHRRAFLLGSTAAAALIGGGQVYSNEPASALTASSTARLDRFIETEMAARNIPGLSACLIHEDAILWQESYGFADLESKSPMTADHIQNIGSISKTFTMLAVMQQVEAGLIALDADVNDYLPFSLQHPKFPDRRISTRMLLQHRSALRDGAAYPHHYACGDPRMSLGVWVRRLFESGADFYDPDENFAPWAPGDAYEYSNTAFGLLGHLVEITSGMEFSQYCHRNIFEPLGMNQTSWMLADIDISRHAIPYTWVEDATARGPSWGGMPLGVIRPDGATLREALSGGYQENCLYSHPNYTDGFLRTSVNQLSIWARLWLNDGSVDGVRLLSAATVRQINEGTRILDGGNDFLQGLAWHSGHKLEEHLLWGHGGGDPGVDTDLLMLREKRLAAIVFANTNGVTSSDFTIEILREGLTARNGS